VAAGRTFGRLPLLERPNDSRPDRRYRDSSQIQFTSQLFPPSSENDCSMRADCGEISDGLLTFEPAIGGMHVTGLFRDASIDDRAVAAESARRGVPVDPLSKYGAIDCGGLVFGYAGASREEARERLNVVRRSITDISRR